MERKRHIAIATTGRADWGLLSPIAASLREAGAEVGVIAANMHFLPEAGFTVTEIEDDGFEPIARIKPGKTPVATAALTMQGVGDALAQWKADAMLLLGDRYEMTGVAAASVMSGVPIAHIGGGAVSEGAFDDAFRHAITKMATLHFAETEQNRRRIIRMGEDPQRVITTGAIGVYNLFHTKALSRRELSDSLGMEIGERCVLATLHSATLDAASPAEQMAAMLNALDRFADLQVILTHPNNDVDVAPMILLMERWAARRKGRAIVVPSLGRVRYLSALKLVRAVVGNSSSGIVEVPSAGIPTLDIGIRQQGRLAAESVVHCACDADSIAGGLEKVLSEPMQQLARRCDNPYARPDTPQLMTSTLMTYPFTPFPSKSFYEY